MGIFKSIKNKFVGTSEFDSHFFADDATQQANTDAVAKQVAALMQSPTIKVREEGREIHVAGTYRGRAARVVLDVSFGKASSEIKLLSHDRCYFLLTHDSTTAEVYAATCKDRDQWDDRDEDIKNYVSRNVCFEGDREKIVERRALWDSFAPDLQAALIKMADTWHGSFKVRDGTASIEPWEGVLGRPDAAQVMQAHLELAARAAEAVEARMSRLR